jgi:hypothetical protein
MAVPDAVAPLLARLAEQGRMPREALAEAVTRWDELAPIVIDMIDKRPSEVDPSPQQDDGLFLIIHLCAQQREQRAYRPLLRLVSGDADLVEHTLGDAITEKLGKIIAAVFDGETAPLHEAILSPSVDQYVRDALLEGLTRLTQQGRISRDDTLAFLRRCDAEMQPRRDNHAWCAWQEAVAVLGFTELQEAVERAFREERIHPDFMSYSHFQEDLAETLAGRLPRLWKDQPFGEVAEELKGWQPFLPKPKRERHFDLNRDRSSVSNPHRGVGRNDPCPCGSGKKYKKCCLAA